ncbi:transmembrane O-methyltransferase homolog isoform X2 [Hypomesus transpacificus]|uniref:transmembrane O-methyltransferase homolog isoform X2 n=1 Tax=Hypomesus transpacificus TaxID=137520 RepID=UPI001F072E01|nr:transmembrane O-methyltransferase homolog isoform X2 [Hypomesus transpacificus]
MLACVASVAEVSSETGEVLDEAVRRVAPRCVLELGTHCGYASIRILRLLPPGGRLLTVEQDAQSADLAEELILVAGFKHTQFQILNQPSAEAIPALSTHLGPKSRLDMILMDHDPQRYLPDLLLLERQGLLSPAGSVLLVCCPQGPQSLSPLLEHLGAQACSVRAQACSVRAQACSVRAQTCSVRAQACSVRAQAPGLLELNCHSDHHDGGEGS